MSLAFLKSIEKNKVKIWRLRELELTLQSDVYDRGLYGFDGKMKSYVSTRSLVG